MMSDAFSNYMDSAIFGLMVVLITPIIIIGCVVMLPFYIVGKLLETYK